MAEGGRRRQLAKMVGELCREAAVLIAVLAPMETIIVGNGLTTRSIVTIVVLSSFLGGYGLYLGLNADE
jgi:hypothetical protein